ncbi:hypothetical protein [Cohnella sp. WQ 127256]|uniref:hypothetical protein n=1 Tax=Cohnella sp. WQ 127256 TaxID=2938790 RepID=UPI0021181448|nr:hypothetical protein [Cohnella sp. WQ 127256]
MSQANIPNITPSISVKFGDAINLLLISIALEEIGLAHILNAEGEKLQYVLGTLPGTTPLQANISQILTMNESVRETIKVIAKGEWILQQKLESVVDAMKTGNPTSNFT